MIKVMIMLCVVGILVAIALPLWASPPDNRPPDNRPPGGNGNGGNDVSIVNGVSVTAGGGDSTSAASAEIGGVSGGEASAAVGDITVNVETGGGGAALQSQPTQLTTGSTSVTNSNVTKVPRQVPNAYFNYTPNFISCGRVIGFQYGNSSGIGSFGVPWFRDRSCDIWLAVNEAQENGHIVLSYAFMCEIKNIRQVWGKERCDAVTAEAVAWMETELPLYAEVEPQLIAEVTEEQLEAELAEQRTIYEEDIRALEARVAEAERRAAAAARQAEQAKPEWRDKLKHYKLKSEEDQ